MAAIANWPALSAGADSGKRPNILYMMADDHAASAISAYGSRVNRTPNIDRLAEGGMRFDNCFCTNSICTPSRAVILTHSGGRMLTGSQEFASAQNPHRQLE